MPIIFSFARFARVAPQRIDDGGVTFVHITAQPCHCLVLSFKPSLPICERTQAYLVEL